MWKTFKKTKKTLSSSNRSRYATVDVHIKQIIICKCKVVHEMKMAQMSNKTSQLWHKKEHQNIVESIKAKNCSKQHCINTYNSRSTQQCSLRFLAGTLTDAWFLIRKKIPTQVLFEVRKFEVWSLKARLSTPGNQLGLTSTARLSTPGNQHGTRCGGGVNWIEIKFKTNWNQTSAALAAPVPRREEQGSVSNPRIEIQTNWNSIKLKLNWKIELNPTEPQTDEVRLG